MAILDVLRPADGLPVVVVISSTDLARRAADVLRELAMGAVIRVDDVRSGRTVAWLSASPPEAVRSVLPLMPAPGEARDWLAGLEVTDHG